MHGMVLEVNRAKYTKVQLNKFIFTMAYASVLHGGSMVAQVSLKTCGRTTWIKSSRQS
jgi:hypothetical protein